MGKLRVFISSAHIQNIAKLLSANVVAQVIGLVVYPILSRIYAPEDFGLLNLFLSIGGVIAILATAELYNAIVLPKDDKEGVAVVHICFYLLLLVVGITTISIFFTDSIASLFKTTTLAKYYWAMPILVFALGMWNILNYWYIRVSSYDRISGYQLSSSLLSAGAKVSLGYLNILQGGMIYSVVFAPIASLLVSVVLSWKKGIKQLFHSSQMDLRAVAKKYRNFPLYSLPKSLVNMLAGQLPVLLLTPVFGTREVGFWSMALLLSFAPISLISRSFYQVLYQQIVARINKGQTIGHYFRRFTLFILSMGIPFFSLLYWFMPNIVEVFLGKEWLISGTYIQWLLPWLLCSLLTSSTGFLADVFFKQHIGFGFEILTVTLRTLGVVAGVIMQDFSISIIGYAAGSAIAVLAQFIWLANLAKRYDKRVLENKE